MKKLIIFLALTPYLAATPEGSIIVRNYADLPLTVKIKGPEQLVKSLSGKSLQADESEYIGMKLIKLLGGNYCISISRPEPGILSKFGIGSRSPRTLKKVYSGEEGFNEETSQEEIYWNTEINDHLIVIELTPQTTETDQRVILAHFSKKATLISEKEV